MPTEPSSPLRVCTILPTWNSLSGLGMVHKSFTLPIPIVDVQESETPHSYPRFTTKSPGPCPSSLCLLSLAGVDFLVQVTYDPDHPSTQPSVLALQHPMSSPSTPTPTGPFSLIPSCRFSAAPHDQAPLRTITCFGNGLSPNCVEFPPSLTASL